MIANSFGLYIVMSKYSNIMGVYQTFGQALDRISELLGTARLVENLIDDQCIRYHSGSDHRRYFDVHRTNFFQHTEYPLVAAGADSFIEKVKFSSCITNK